MEIVVKPTSITTTATVVVVVVVATGEVFEGRVGAM